MPKGIKGLGNLKGMELSLGRIIGALIGRELTRPRWIGMMIGQEIGYWVEKGIEKLVLSNDAEKEKKKIDEKIPEILPAEA